MTAPLTVCKDVFFHMRRIRQLRRFVDENTVHLVRALMILAVGLLQQSMCRLYNNHSTSTAESARWDAAARLLCGAAPRVHARPLLQQLHWLPVVIMFIKQKGLTTTHIT